MLRKFVLVNGRLVMELTSNLALSSSASAISGNDIYGHDESASSDGACLHIHRPHLLPLAAAVLLHRPSPVNFARQQAGSLTPGLGISPMIKGVMSSMARARMRASADFVHIAHTLPRGGAVQGGAPASPRHLIERLTIWDRTEWLNDLCRS